MSVNEAHLPDEHEQEKAVEDFFLSLDELDDDQEAPEEPVEPPVVAEADEDAPDDAEEPEEPAEELSEDDDGDDEDADEASEEEPEPDSWEKRYKDQQSFHERQMHEMREQLAALQTWAQNSYQQQLAQHQALLQAQQAAAAQPTQNPLAHLSPQSPELKASVEQDLQRTFVAVAQHRPDLMAATIAQAREVHGHQVGDEMQLEYNNYLMQQQAAQQQAQWDALRAQQEAAQAPAMIEQTMNQLVDDIAAQYGDAFEVIRDDFIARAQETAPAFREYMEQRGLEMTPDAINYFLQKCVNDVREERINAEASKPRRPRRVAKTEHVEASTNNDGNRPEDMTADELAISELLEGAKELSIDISPTS